MKSIHLLYFIFFICCSCAKTTKQSEYYDVVATSEYDNIYNSKGKLDSVKITETQLMYQLDVLASIDVDITLRKYTYRNDSLYSIIETRGTNKDITETTYYKDKAKETITIRDNKDTINYSLRLCKEYGNEKTVYERRKCRISSEPITNFTIDDNYEEWAYYDNECATKIIRHDFNTSQTEETYYFYDIPYKVALQKIPKSNNKQIIRCYASSSIQDTLVENASANGEIDQITKKYKDNGKEIEHVYDAEGYETLSIEYKDKGLDISVVNSTFMGNRTDSTYTKNGKIMREATITDDSKRIVTYDYDSHGNIIKRVEKTKFLD